MNVVYLGTSDFAAGVLEMLVAGGCSPALVVTRPDRPRGRGRKLAAPAVADTARELGLDLDQPENVNGEEARARIAAARPDFVCVCAYGEIIAEPLLSEHEMINVHPSLLPRWRGAAPVERAIMAGDPLTGVCVMRVEAGLDSGAVALTQEEQIEARDTYGTLALRLQRIGGELLLRALREPLHFSDQDEAGATYAEKIGPEDRTLDPTRPAAELDRVVRALQPHIGARVELPNGSWLGVSQARVLDTGPGAGSWAGADGTLVLGTPSGALELLEVQPPGGRPMPASDYVRGHGIPV